MMPICTFGMRTICRSILMPVCLLTALLAGTRVAHAQFPCECDHATIVVSADVGCSLLVGVRTDAGIEFVLVSPGTVSPVPCQGNLFFYIQDDTGNLVFVPEGGLRIVEIEEDCFVDAVVVRDEDGCLYLRVARSILLTHHVERKPVSITSLTGMRCDVRPGKGNGA